MSAILEQARQARAASRAVARLDRSRKDAALGAIAAKLRESVQAIGEANALDLSRGRELGLSEPMLDRLRMGPRQIEQVAQGVEFIQKLEDPIGSRSDARRLPNGLLIARQRLPLGVIAIIYESRPNVTVDAAALCLKSGNTVLLRGGKEAQETNAILGSLIQQALSEQGVSEHAVQIISAASGRGGTAELLGLSGWIDLAIPRGGEGLIRFVTEHARVPVVQHYKGVCHLFLDEDAELEMATALVMNAKVQRPGVCNALECLLVHQGAAARLLPGIGEALKAAEVEVRGCPATLALLPWATPAGEADYGAEFLAKILAVRVVPGLDAALEHVQTYGSNHTESICTNNLRHATRWVDEVDASCVLVNASTRFNDGGELGLGAEMGISTSKLHAYGPMGLESLTTQKWVVFGEGQIRT